jgi:hypothetical protein
LPTERDFSRTATARWQLGIAPELPASGVFGASLHLRKERAGRSRVFEGLDPPLERSYGMLVHLRDETIKQPLTSNPSAYTAVSHSSAFDVAA